MLLTILEFLAILLTALALIPGGAHALALPNKIRLPQERYFAAQQIYQGWALVGIVSVAALAADLALAYALRDQPTASWLSLAGGLCLAATLVMFFVCIWPANQDTDDWSSTPPNWQALRKRWEYGHLANAVLTLAALCLVIAGVMTARTPVFDSAG